MEITEVRYGFYYIEYIVKFNTRLDKLVHYECESHSCNDLIRIVKTAYNYILIPTNMKKVLRKYLCKYIEPIEAF